MVLSFDRLQALRDCCRDDAAFVRLRQLLGLTVERDGFELPPADPEADSAPSACPHLLRGIAEATHLLLTGPDWSAAIGTMLQILGEATGVDRVYVFVIHPHPDTGEPSASQRWEWVQSAIAPQIHNPLLQNRPYTAAGLSRWYDLLRSGQSIRGRTSEFSPAEQRILRSQDIRAVLIVPIFVDGVLWGCIGFDECRRDRLWSEDDESALHLMAASLGGAIARQQIQEASHQSEARYRAMLDASPDQMFRLNRQGQYLDFKGNASSDIPREAIVGHTIRELLPPPVADICERTVQQALETGELQTCEYQLENSHGLRDFEARVVTGGQDEVLCIVRDITERKQAEDQLRLSEEKFSKAFRASPNLMSIATLMDGRLIEVNDSFVEVMGFSREEAVGQQANTLHIWVRPQDRSTVVRQLLREGTVKNFECQFRIKSGEIRIGLFSAERIDIGEQPCLIDVVVDITERKRAEQQLWAAAERDRLVSQITLRIRQSLDLSQILNTTVKEVHAFLKADRVCIGHKLPNNQAIIVAESVNAPWQSLHGLVIQSQEQMRELYHLFDQGQVRATDDVRSLTHYPAMSAYYLRFQVQASLAVPILLENELFGLLVAHQCSGPRHWESYEIELLSQLATQVSIAVQQANLYQQVRDLNAGLERQVQERTAQLRQKMEELQELNDLKDEFLNAFSHDLKTPVMGISLVLNNLLNQPGESIPINRAILERMAQSTNNQLHLILSMLESHSAETRGLSLHYELVQLSLLVQVIVEDLEPLVSKNSATLLNQVPPDLPLINADPVQLRRVFENLITNALNHNPPGVTITLSATVEEDLIRVTIHDDGVGMSRETCDRLFQRYTRGPKSRHTGIGLGLYLCRQIITAHGGQIGVASAAGQGSTFCLTLPLAIPTGANPAVSED